MTDTTTEKNTADNYAGQAHQYLIDLCRPMIGTDAQSDIPPALFDHLTGGGSTRAHIDADGAIHLFWING